VIPGRCLRASRLFAIVDLSWWLMKAWALACGDHPENADLAGEQMIRTVVGWMLDLLDGEAPAFVAVALDSIGPTFRHLITAGMPKEYKGTRSPKPRQFYQGSERVQTIIAALRIPMLWAETWEADDAIATAERLARELGLDVAIISLDKDLKALCWDDGPTVTYLWDTVSGVCCGAAEVLAAEKLGVRPDQVRDFLALTGDRGDNVPGVRGLGAVGAQTVLRRWDTIEAIFAAPDGDIATLGAEVVRLEKERNKAKRRAAKPGLGAEDKAAHEATVEHISALIERTRVTRDAEGYRADIMAARADVELAIRLVTLDDEAPIAWDPSELPVGGFDADRLRPIFETLGFAHHARTVRSVPKGPAPGAA
jgi:5'-3' exonuclease